jgi:hypothetical protein
MSSVRVVSRSVAKLSKSPNPRQSSAVLGRVPGDEVVSSVDKDVSSVPGDEAISSFDKAVSSFLGDEIVSSFDEAVSSFPGDEVVSSDWPGIRRA